MPRKSRRKTRRKRGGGFDDATPFILALGTKGLSMVSAETFLYRGLPEMQTYAINKKIYKVPTGFLNWEDKMDDDQYEEGTEDGGWEEGDDEVPLYTMGGEGQNCKVALPGVDAETSSEAYDKVFKHLKALGESTGKDDGSPEYKTASYLYNKCNGKHQLLEKIENNPGFDAPKPVDCGDGDRVCQKQFKLNKVMAYPDPVGSMKDIIKNCSKNGPSTAKDLSETYTNCRKKHGRVFTSELQNCVSEKFALQCGSLSGGRRRKRRRTKKKRRRKSKKKRKSRRKRKRSRRRKRRR